MSNEQNYDDLRVGQIWRDLEGDLWIIRGFPVDEQVSYDVHFAGTPSSDYTTPVLDACVPTPTLGAFLEQGSAELIYEPPVPKRKLKVGQVWQYAGSGGYRVIVATDVGPDGDANVHTALRTGIGRPNASLDYHTEVDLQRILEENRAYLASS